MTKEEIEKVASVMLFSACLYVKDMTEGFSGKDVIRLCEEFKRQFATACEEIE